MSLTSSMIEFLRRCEREGRVMPSPSTGQTAAALERRGLVHRTGKFLSYVELTEAGRELIGEWG